MREFGLRAVIAPSFGGIFFNNCFRNGIVPVALPIEKVKELVAAVEESQGLVKIHVDLQAKQVSLPDGKSFSFDVPETLRQMLLLGIDEIDQTLSYRDELDAYRAKDKVKRPWAYLEPTVTVPA
jgi:3-isopropylmalate/(R)-2-methylmalate dehydratase small subunit